MKVYTIVEHAIMMCDICHVNEATVIYEPNDPKARIEACKSCAKQRGYIK